MKVKKDKSMVEVYVDSKKIIKMYASMEGMLIPAFIEKLVKGYEKSKEEKWNLLNKKY